MGSQLVLFRLTSITFFLKMERTITFLIVFLVLARASSSWPAKDRNERSAEAGFVQTYEIGARLENIGANGTSSGVQVVTNRNPGRHVLGGGSNQKSKPRRGQGANRNGNPSNPNQG